MTESKKERRTGKVRELGMGYGGQQGPKEETGDIYKTMADAMNKPPIFDQLPGRLHRLGQKIPIYTIPARDYFKQLHQAGVWERDHYAALRRDGWQLHPAGFYWHFWKPGVCICPG